MALFRRMRVVQDGKGQEEAEQLNCMNTELWERRGLQEGGTRKTPLGVE